MGRYRLRVTATQVLRDLAWVVIDAENEEQARHRLEAAEQAEPTAVGDELGPYVIEGQPSQVLLPCARTVRAAGFTIDEIKLITPAG